MSLLQQGFHFSSQMLLELPLHFSCLAGMGLDLKRIIPQHLPVPWKELLEHRIHRSWPWVAHLTSCLIELRQRYRPLAFYLLLMGRDVLPEPILPR
jgi:hypothetical protein